MRLLKQSTARDILVFMTDALDHVTGKAGLTLTITASKNGAAFGSITPTVTERGSGWYALALTSSHTDTLGDLALHITGTGADPTDLVSQVVADLPGASVASVTGAVGSVSGLTAANLDVAVSTRVAAADYTAPDNASITAIKAKTDNLPASPASEGNVTAVGNAVNAVGVLVEAIPTNPLLTNDARLDTLDAAVSSRLATSGYTAPDNAGIAAIKAKTDNLPASPAGTTLKQNTAIDKFTFQMLTESGSPAAGLSVTAKRSIDGGALAACANSVVEISAGFYYIDLATSDLNGKVIALEFSASGAVKRQATLVMES